MNSIKKTVFILLLLLTFKSNYSFAQQFGLEQDTIRIKDLGYSVNSRENVVSYVNKAIAMCNPDKNSIILFESGRYDFWEEGAIEKPMFISNTTPAPLRRSGVHIENLKNITIEGNGASFIFHGKFQPFSIISSSNIAIENVSIDWDIPFSAEARIIDVNSNYFDLEIDRLNFPYEVRNEKLYFVGEGWQSMWGGEKWNDPIEFDYNTKQVTELTHDDLLSSGWEKAYKAEQLQSDSTSIYSKVRIYYNRNEKLRKGNYIVLRHSVRDHCGIFMDGSNDILLKNINMYSNTGLSYLAQYCSNLTLINTNCLPSPKRKIISGHDDGLHFSNCKGDIIIDGCKIEGLMDDAVNVHGSYVIITKIKDKNTLECKFPHFQSVGLPWAVKGDKVDIIKGDNMKVLSSVSIKSIRNITAELFEICFNEDIPSGVKEKDALQNVTWEPNVYIRNCYFGHHRARGVLVSTGGDIEIENNVFQTSGAAIVVPGDLKSYYESAPVKKLLIKGNVFKDGCLTSEYLACDAIITISLDRFNDDFSIKPIHSGVKILNNTFNSFDYPVLYAKSVDGIEFSNNVLNRSYSHTQWNKNKYTLTFDGCKKIVVLNNKIDKDLLGKNIRLLHSKRLDLKLKSPNLVLVTK